MRVLFCYIVEAYNCILLNLKPAYIDGYPFVHSRREAICHSLSQPHDVVVPSSPLPYQFTAEAWSHWAIYLAPVLLCGCFRSDSYYKHFMELVAAMRACFDFHLTYAGVDQLEDQLASWVQKFES